MCVVNGFIDGMDILVMLWDQNYIRRLGVINVQRCGGWS